MTNQSTFPDDVKARFWSRVDVRGPDDCWPWTGTAREDGRGTLFYRGSRVTAPRLSLALADGIDLPSTKIFACHTCDNPSCVNPAHLWWGDVRSNNLDCGAKMRRANSLKTHCLQGHSFSGGNLRIKTRHGGRTERVCRTCQRASSNRAKAVVAAIRALPPKQGD